MHPMSKNSTHQQCVGDLKVAHGRVWRWRQQHWEAVQGPMTDSGLRHAAQGRMRRRYSLGPWQIRAWQQLWEAPNLCASTLCQKILNTPACVSERT
ncbi:unnamed protein product [Staurois parvus]|uniref:Uncharacterized protein n=1 Tax=Staurois parvus TaxID=386267 RepID=A0ABN9GZC3_9NEOB|nr:unnamed protein product [Staurois parvus]